MKTEKEGEKRKTEKERKENDREGRGMRKSAWT